MSEETPKFRALTVELFVGELRTGLWCNDCFLGSGIRQVLHVGSPDSKTTVTVARCMDDPNHTRIEET